ncbi:MAG: hypothetical protein GXO87_11525 [Chlorobi bacterium]|nr:hypothetical protein [Chlorobiota bacterium]
MKKILVIFTLLINAQLFGQMSGSIGATDAIAMAMGKSSVVFSKGVYSINVNPANLALKQNHSFEISSVLPIPNGVFLVGNEFISFEDFNYYFGGEVDEFGNVVGREISEADKERLLNSMNDGSDHFASSSLNLFSISYDLPNSLGAIGFSINEFAAERGTVPRDLVDFMLNGNEIGKKYSLDALQFRSLYMREYSVSYGMTIKGFLSSLFENFSAGISLKLVHGFGYSNIERADISLETMDDYSIRLASDFLAKIAVSEDYNIEWDFLNVPRKTNWTPFPSPAGTGFGFDIGFTGVINDKWRVAMALSDVGSINWKNETVAYASNGEYTITDITDGTLSDTLKVLLEPQGSFTDGFSTPLPSVLRMGVGYGKERLNVAFGYEQGLNDQPSNTTAPRFSLGAEFYALEFLPIRTGFSAGGVAKFEWSLGFGLDFGLIEMNFATSDIVSFFQGSGAKKSVFAFGSRWKF